MSKLSSLETSSSSAYRELARLRGLGAGNEDQDGKTGDNGQPLDPKIAQMRDLHKVVLSKIEEYHSNYSDRMAAQEADLVRTFQTRTAQVCSIILVARYPTSPSPPSFLPFSSDYFF